MKSAIFLLLPATAMLYFPMAYEEFEQPKAFALITFACFSGFFVKWKIILNDHIAQTLFIFTISAALSTLFSIDWHLSLFGNVKCRSGLLVIASYLVFYLAISEYLNNKESANKAIDIILACSTIVVIYAIAQVLGYDFKKWTGTLKEYNYIRPMSFLGHPNFMAGYLAMILPFGLWRINNLETKIQKIIFSQYLTLCISVIFLSLSRGMIISAAIGIIIYFFKTKEYKKLIHLFLSISVISVVILTFLPSFRQTASSRMEAFIKPGPARIEYPKAAIRIWRRYPWFGIGTDAYELGFQHQRTDHYWQIERAGSPHKAHNDFLNILATQGLFGALAAILMTIAIINRAFISKSSFSAPAISSIIMFYIEGMTSFTVVATGVLFLLCVALLKVNDA